MRLCRAAVRYSLVTGDPNSEPSEDTGALIDLEGAYDNYASIIGPRRARRLRGGVA